MAKNLLIVESPAKAKTIEKYLGTDFTVKSSYGHIRDLDKGNDAIDVQNNFNPKYIISPEKNKVVRELKELVKKTDEVWLATDEDREGEAISWHLCKTLGLDERTTKRIVFREITKPAILKAVQNPRLLDLNLVDAQQARRILDRLVGFELSELLWKKIKGKLSAGRVQSVAVKLIVEKEKEIQQFNSEPYFRVVAYFEVPNDKGKLVTLKAELPGNLAKPGDAEAFLQACTNAQYEIKGIDVRPLTRRPAAPFTTSTLQQEASRKLGYSVNRTMSVAQRLYEGGFITYMRTDSTSLSELAIQSIMAEVEKVYGANYVEARRYKSKSANAQEAHEAIRPTYIERQNVSGNKDEQRLYELIWKRTLASQMAEAKLEKTVVDIGISTMPKDKLQAEGEVLKFDGFLAVYLESDDDENDDEVKGMLPPLKKGQLLNLDHMDATERFTRPPARYTEASLVKKLEELGIGRPSTYAPIISKIMEEERGYVVKENREGVQRAYQQMTLAKGAITKASKTETTGEVKNRLFATEMGITVADFLDEHFDVVMNYHFTAEIEKRFDDIASGDLEWQKMLKDFYFPFHDTVEKTTETADRPSRERILGKDPKTGRTVLVRLSRNGPVVQIGVQDELLPKEKPQYANLRPGQTLDGITFEEAIVLFDLPRSVGTYKGEDIVVGLNRFGAFARFSGENYATLPRTLDPYTVTLEEVMPAILEKEEADKPAGMYQGKPINKGKGRFGPFLKWNDLFVNVPRKYSLETIAESEMIELIKAKVDKEANRFIQQWEEEGIAIENGRWGPFIRVGKEMISLPKKENQKMTNEEAAILTLAEVKAIINEVKPEVLQKKATTKKATTKKATTKKTTTKKK